MAKIDDSIKKKVPELRFKGFTDDWEQRKLTEIVNRVNKSSNSDVLPKVEFEDIVSGEGRLNKDISSKFDSRKGTLFEPENILYGKLRPYLKNWLFSDFEGVALGDFWVFEATDVSVPSFDYYLIQSDNYQKVANDTSGTKMPRSDWKNVSSTDFAIPSKDEQKQIGAFFKQLDNTIVLHQRRLDLLKEQKKGYLQKMFPKNGEKVPELRFAGFADDWEQHKLGDLATSFEYGLNASAKSFDGTHKYIRITDIDDSSRKFNSQSLTSPDIDLSSADNYKLKNGDILFARTGASVGKSYIYADSDGLVYYAGFLIRARIKSGVDSNFVFQHTLTSSYENFIRVTSQRSGQPGVNAKEYSTFEISVPSYEEQRKIGSFFKQLDDTITLHQRKLDLLKEQKKGFLQKMFV